MNTTIKTVSTDGIGTIAAIDRAETIEAEYLAEPCGDGEGLALRKVTRDPPIQRPGWSTEGLAERIALWKTELEQGGLMLGAFSGDGLVGFAVLGHTYPDNSAELAAIFVDKEFRGIGIGSSLMRQAEEHARGSNLTALFIKSVATAATVDFYRRHGYQVISIIDKSLIECLPWDVVLAKEM